MDLTKMPPPDSLPKRPDAGTAATLTPRLPLAQISDSPADAALPAALVLADPVHIHPLDFMGALRIMIAEVRAELTLPDEPVAAMAPQTVVQFFLQALPPPEILEPQLWLAAALEVEDKVQVALDRAVQVTAAWRDVPLAVVAGARETRDGVVAAITDDAPNPLWLRPEWLGLAPRMERYWRRRRRARRWLSDPDPHWRERDEHAENFGKDGG